MLTISIPNNPSPLIVATEDLKVGHIICRTLLPNHTLGIINIRPFLTQLRLHEVALYRLIHLASWSYL